MSKFVVTNSRGTSLIQVIIAVAVLGIVTLGFATVMSNMATSQKIAQARNDLNSIANEVQMMFSNSTVCEASLPAGTTFDPAKAAVSFPPLPGTSFQYNGSPFRFKINQDTLEDGAVLRGYELIANKIQLVNAIDLGASGANTVYKVSVIGQFSPKGTKGYGLSDFSVRQLTSGYVSVAGGTIVSCSAESPNDLGKVAENCQSFGGTYDLTTKTCLTKANPNDPDLVASITKNVCQNLGGTMNGTQCRLPASGGAGTATAGKWAFGGKGSNGPACAGIGAPTNQLCSPLGSTCSYTYGSHGTIGGIGGGYSLPVTGYKTDYYRCQ